MSSQELGQARRIPASTRTAAPSGSSTRTINKEYTPAQTGSSSNASTTCSSALSSQAAASLPDKISSE